MCRYYRLFWLDSLRATRHAPLAQNRQVTRVRRHRASPLLSSSLPPGPQITARTQEVCSYSLHIGG